MPESRVRKAAAEKKKARKAQARNVGRRDKKLLERADSRSWVAPAFLITGLLGVIWLIVYYIAGSQIPYMSSLGQWNALIGIGLMGASLLILTQWK